MLNRISGIFLIVSMSACATQAGYVAPDLASDQKFLMQDIGINEYRLTYFAKPETSRATIEDYLLYRSAEFTIENGFDSFTLSTEAVDSKPLYDVVSCPASYDHYSHDLEGRYHNFQYYAYKFDWAGKCDESVHEYTPYSAMTYITMYREADVPVDPNVFTAHTVLENLGPEECWQQETHDHAACKLQFP